MQKCELVSDHIFFNSSLIFRAELETNREQQQAKYELLDNKYRATALWLKRLEEAHVKLQHNCGEVEAELKEQKELLSQR